MKFRFKNLFWGLFFILSAVLVIISQLGVTEINLIHLLITIFLVAILCKSLYRINFFGILFSIAFMGILYAEPLGITNLTPWPILGAALFASIGLSFLIHPKRHYYHHSEHFDEIVDKPDDSTIDFHVSYGSSIKYINNDNFKGGNIYCSFGAMKVYFDHAKLSKEGATVHLDVSFAGAELYVPKEWNVVNRINTTLGGVEEKNLHNGTGPELVLIGNVSFAGVEIIYI